MFLIFIFNVFLDNSTIHKNNNNTNIYKNQVLIFIIFDMIIEYI